MDAGKGLGSAGAGVWVGTGWTPGGRGQGRRIGDVHHVTADPKLTILGALIEFVASKS